MAKIDPKKWAKLKEAWDAYGHATTFEELDGLKTDSRCGYVVVRWTSPHGVEMADLARGGSGPWEMQNDGIGPITEAEWKNLRIEPECDNFYIPGHAEYKPWGSG